MFKSSRFVQEINCPGTSSLTPIRDYDNDYFHINDGKLPVRPEYLYKRAGPIQLPIAKNKKSIKRPASLVLTDKIDVVNKKQCSPLNLKKFNKLVQIEDNYALNVNSAERAEINPSITEFFKRIRSLYESEMDYAAMMELSNAVYRKNLNENPLFKDKLVGIDSHDEMLIFGNIETMSSISRLFLKGLRDGLLHEDFEVVDDRLWNEMETNVTLQSYIAETFDIGKIFNLNFLRIKSTYLTYFVTHRKQMEFFDFMRVGNEELFKKWYRHCLSLAGMCRLEDIFERPIRRLSEWTAILKTLATISKSDSVQSQFCDNISITFEQYRSFEKYVEDEISEFNGTIKYDFSLTPIEIIQSYGVDGTHEDNTIQSPQNQIERKITKKEIKRLTKRNSSKTLGRSTRTASIFSGTSSRYSQYDVPSITEPPLSLKEENSYAKLDCAELSDTTVVNLTLCDHVESFKKVYKGLLNLKKAFAKENMISLIDLHLEHAKVWKTVIECIDDYEFAIKEDPTLFITSMHNEYIEKLQRLREDAAVMKVTELETSVKEPLAVLIKFCDSVKVRLQDLNVLKKDYLAYLREKESSAQDMKREILAHHFEKLQNKLLRELPIFLDLVYQISSLVILNYHKMMLKYLEITAGGDLFLIKDLELLGNLRKDVGRNFDILQSYSTSRFCSKRYVRDNWSFSQDQTQSRILRKLFEL